MTVQKAAPAFYQDLVKGIKLVPNFLGLPDKTQVWEEWSIIGGDTETEGGLPRCPPQ